MCILFANIPAIFIVAVAGFFALCALIISKICSFVASREIKTTQCSAYECGFDAVKLDGFVSEKNYAISVYLLLELLFIWLLSCITICVMQSNRYDKDLVNLSALLLSFFMMLVARSVFHTKISERHRYAAPFYTII